MQVHMQQIEIQKGKNSSNVKKVYFKPKNLKKKKKYYVRFRAYKMKLMKISLHNWSLVKEVKNRMPMILVERPERNIVGFAKMVKKYVYFMIK